MKVVHLVHNFPPEFTGGTERYLSELVPLQREAGLEVQVLCGSEERREQDQQRERWQGVEVTRLFRRPDERFGVLFQVPRIVKLLRARLAEIAPDLLHVHHWFNLSDRLLQELPEVAAVATFHDAYAVCPRFFLLRPEDGGYCGHDLPIPVERCEGCLRPDDGEPELRERIQQRRAGFAGEVARLARALVPSRFHGEILIGAGLLPRERLRILPLGLAQMPARPQHRPVPGRLRLVSFGHLSRIKGVDLLLEAVAELSQSGAVELHLFGGLLEADAADLRRLAEGLPVTFHGPFERSDLARAAGDLDLAVFPSRAFETYSLVLEEALALGLPAVVSDRGALPDRVGRAGRAVAVEDSRALVEVLQRLRDHPEELQALREGVPASAAALDEHERALREIYREALHDGPQQKVEEEKR